MLLVLNIILLIVSALFLPSAAITCGSGQKVCGTTCYNPSFQACQNGIACGNGLSVCGTTCYNSQVQSCQNGILCNAGQSLCGTTCYYPMLSTCKSSNVLVCTTCYGAPDPFNSMGHASSI